MDLLSISNYLCMLMIKHREGENIEHRNSGNEALQTPVAVDYSFINVFYANLQVCQRFDL